MSIEGDINVILDDPKKIRQLLTMEKSRRGIPDESLLFINMSNVASQIWCSMKAVLKTHSEELKFFEAYLYDRLRYANKLVMIKTLPRKLEKLLTIGEEITYEQIEALEATEPFIKKKNDSLRDQQIAKMDWRRRGLFFEERYAEQHPQFRWHFPWEDFIILGLPDGIREDFVYEFKSTKNARYVKERMEEASIQADLYGLFFRRAKKRVQVYCLETDRTESSETNVNKERANQYIRNFKRVALGEHPKLPASYKCRVCEFLETCPLQNKTTTNLPAPDYVESKSSFLGERKSSQE